MQYTGLYFLRLADVPEIFAEISAGTAGYVHFTLVFIVADGAFPLIIVVDNNFAVEAAHVTIVRLSVKFGILDSRFHRAELFHTWKFPICAITLPR